MFGLEHRLSNDPLYSLPDADYIASGKRGTIRRWLEQYPDLAQSNQEMLSYHAALQMVAVAALRRDGVSMRHIRNMLRFLRTEMENPYPFLTQRFYVGGKQVFLENLETMMEISSTQGQLAWASVILPFLHELDFMEELAVGWWPLGRKNFVLVNPDYGYGLPIIAGTFVRTEILKDRFLSVGDMNEVAKEFEIPFEAVQQAILFEDKRLAA